MSAYTNIHAYANTTRIQAETPIGGESVETPSIHSYIHIITQRERRRGGSCEPPFTLEEHHVCMSVYIYVCEAVVYSP